MLSETSGPTQSEHNWAMLAHLTALLTVLVGLHTGGMGAVVALLFPLGMYVYFSGRSRYVAFHALQATAFQAAGGMLLVLVTVVVGAGVAGAWLVTGLLSVVLVGLLFVPLSLALTLVVLMALLALLVGLLAYPLRGAYLAYLGQPFEYPVIGPLVARTASPAAP